MYCNDCGKENPDNSKFCQHCGCYFETINGETEQDYTSNNDRTFSDNEISNPKLSKAFWITGAISIFSFFYLRSAINNFNDVFFLDFLVMLLIFIICLVICFASIYLFVSNYLLFKKDVNSYIAKKKRDEEYENNLKKAQEARELEEQKKLQELTRKRAEYKANGIASCPRCASTSIATINRGYSIVTGFYGSGKAVNVCQVCGHKWRIGK